MPAQPPSITMASRSDESRSHRSDNLIDESMADITLDGLSNTWAGQKLNSVEVELVGLRSDVTALSTAVTSGFNELNGSLVKLSQELNGSLVKLSQELNGSLLQLNTNLERLFAGGAGAQATI